MFKWFRNRRRKKIAASDWPTRWDLHLQRNVRLTWEMSEQEIQSLKLRIKIFIAEKNWEGLDGLELTDEMKVTIAAQACLMLLGVEDWYFDNVESVLIFPKAFQRETSDGLNQGQIEHRSGEAWQDGPIILSWRDSLTGGRNEDDGKNVVIHEFAHALDGLDGEMAGDVVFDNAEDNESWQRMIEHGYEELCKAKEARRRTLLDHYGAKNPAEYFAVASETFFEQPGELAVEHPKLFSLLKKYYRVNPTSWQRN